MPELPEVETIRRDLSGSLVGRRIVDAVITDPRVVQGFSPTGAPRRDVAPAAFAGRLRGLVMENLHRRGKYLILEFRDGGALIIHLRMTGQLILNGSEGSPRALLTFDDGTRLAFRDTRRFGEWWWAEDWRRDPSIRALGPEPWDAAIDPVAWGRDLRRSGARIQAALLDQRRLAGLGNIYVTEALHLSGIRPTRRCDRIRSAEIAPLLDNIRRVLEEGLAHRGVSFRDYRDAHGERGRAKERLLVYGRAGQPCRRCAATLVAAAINGRGTVYCPRCQA
jgi:formamidopyrimidine-DNA glycosylase